MADVTGTSGTDTLTGTAGADLLASSGTSVVGEWDTMIGLDGADTYSLYATTGGIYRNFIIDDRGHDGAVDQILHAGAMFQSASLGYSAWATVERVGNDMEIHLPSRPYRFHHPGSPEYNIRIVDQFAGAQVETIDAGGTTYQLSGGETGTALADIVAGGAAANHLEGLAGDDFLFGNGGRDLLRMGDGNDTGFGGDGRDRIFGDGGNDVMFGGSGADVMRGGGGNDRMNGDAGGDVLSGGGGFDWLSGGDGADRLSGQGGDDWLDGGAGNDRMVGGRGNDKYMVSVDAHGDDVIVEKGSAGSFAYHDTIEVGGIYGASSGSVADAMAALSFARAGADMHIEIGAGNSVTVRNMFDASRHDTFFVEAMTINGGYWTPLEFRFLDGQVTNIGDDRSHVFPFYGEKLNEVLFGTDGNDRIFGGTGTNFVWTGKGADTLIYKVGDGENLAGLGGGASHDIVMDFNPAKDHFDFTEVAADIGAGYGDLVIGETPKGDATIFLDTGDWTVADIFIELRGVSAAEIDAAMFLF